MAVGNWAWLKLGLMLAVAVLLTASLTGCIWLAVPGLAYEGYQLAHKSVTRRTADRKDQSGVW